MTTWQSKTDQSYLIFHTRLISGMNQHVHKYLCTSHIQTDQTYIQFADTPIQI